MKKLIFATIILLSCLIFKAADAQVRVSIGVNINSQPEWGPVGYDHADYYYLPDIGTYYSIPTHQYIYYSNSRWVRTVYLPERYRNYDLYNGYKVVINERDPWLRDDIYRGRYAGYKGNRNQVIIRDSRDERYRDHWDNGKHKGWYKHEDKYFKQEQKEMKHREKGHGHRNDEDD